MRRVRVMRIGEDGGGRKERDSSRVAVEKEREQVVVGELALRERKEML